MMKEEELIKKWENIGYLNNKSYEQKLLISIKLEEALNFLLVHNYLNKFEQMVFPFIYLLIKRRSDFDVQLAILKFHNKFIIDGYDLNNIDDDFNYLCDFVNGYEF